MAGHTSGWGAIMSKPVNSLYNVNAKPTDAIKSVTMLRPDGDENLENIDFGALLREPLMLHSISRYGLSDKRSGVVGHFGLRRKLEIVLWGEDIRLLETELGITITDEYTFAEPVEFYARMYKGRAFKGISMLNGREFKETVQTALPEPATDTTLYKYHNATLSAFSAQEIGYGSRKIWKLECRDEEQTLIRVEAWGEVNRMLKANGYPELPARGAGRVAVKFDVIIEYKEAYKSYRVVHVYPQDTDTTPDIAPDTQPTQPVRHIIPVTIELTLEEQIAALYRNRDYTVAGILELVAAAVKPSKPVLVSMVADDKTSKIPVMAETVTEVTEIAEDAA